VRPITDSESVVYDCSFSERLGINVAVCTTATQEKQIAQHCCSCGDFGASFPQSWCRSLICIFAQQSLFAGGSTFACTGSREMESDALNAAQMMPRISIFIYGLWSKRCAAAIIVPQREAFVASIVAETR
jgi:hypothetical protein